MDDVQLEGDADLGVILANIDELQGQLERLNDQKRTVGDRMLRLLAFCSSSVGLKRSPVILRARVHVSAETRCGRHVLCLQSVCPSTSSQKEREWAEERQKLVNEKEQLHAQVPPTHYPSLRINNHHQPARVVLHTRRRLA